MKKKSLLSLILFTIALTTQNSYAMDGKGENGDAALKKPTEETSDLAPILNKAVSSREESIRNPAAPTPQEQSQEKESRKSPTTAISTLNATVSPSEKSIKASAKFSLQEEPAWKKIKEKRIPTEVYSGYASGNGRNIKYENGDIEDTIDPDKIQWAKYMLKNPKEHPEEIKRAERKRLSVSQEIRSFPSRGASLTLHRSMQFPIRTGKDPESEFIFSDQQLVVMDMLKKLGGFPKIESADVERSLQFTKLSPSCMTWVTTLSRDSISKQFETMITNGSLNQLCRNSTQKQGAINEALTDLSNKTNPLVYWQRILKILEYAGTEETKIAIGKEKAVAIRNNIIAQIKPMLLILRLLENGRQLQ